MKLTSSDIAHAAKQLDVWALSDNLPVTPCLNELFGEHTFLLDENGLSVVESAVDGEEELRRVVKLATWADKEWTVLAPRPREVTSIVVALSEPACSAERRRRVFPFHDRRRRP